MNQPTGVLTPPRRNPRRGATTVPLHNHSQHHHHHAASSPTPSPAPSASAKRVTRSAVARQLHNSAATHDDAADSANDDLSDPDSDDQSDDSSNADLADDETFARPRQSRGTAFQRTIASTRERRHRNTRTSSSRAQARVRTSSTRPSTSSATRRSTRTRPLASGTPKKRSSPAPKTLTKLSPSRHQQPEWPSSGVIPPWQNLEWTILVQIFDYASHPLDQKSNVRWLLSAGLSCKAFLEPALKTLYRSAMPQLISANTGHKYANLIRHLAAESEAALDRNDHRRTMVESLVVEVSSLPHSQTQTRHFDIAELVLSLPRLSHVELFHEFDLPPYRKLDSKAKKWTYPLELIDALRMAGDTVGALRLRSWTWSARLMTPELISDMHKIHGFATFSQLRKVAFVNFQVPSLQELKDSNIDDAARAKDNIHIALVAGSLGSVGNLKHLVLESSTVVDGQFLSLLPKTIEHLEILNCWEVTANMLGEYLITHGSKLRKLTLHNNQSLSLSFLPLLREFCPELRELSIDLLTYSHHEFYNNSGPVYDTLLMIDEIPSWPKRLEVIELEQLAKWDAETAEMFFQSFVDQARDLPKLRYLAVKAMLDVPWRQRSEFRDKWVSKLKKVFLRKAKKPRPYHSLIQWPLLQDGQPGNQKTQPLKADEDVKMSPPRRSTRPSIAPVGFAPVAPPVSSKGAEGGRKRKRSSTTTRHDLRRSNKRVVLSYRDPDTDEDLDLEEDSSSEDELQKPEEEDTSALSEVEGSPTPSHETEMFIHGLCDVVNIRFDNQKPREFQWGPEDFLDDDVSESNDGEWTSDREMDEDSDAMAW